MFGFLSMSTQLCLERPSFFLSPSGDKINLENKTSFISVTFSILHDYIYFIFCFLALLSFTFFTLILILLLIYRSLFFDYFFPRSSALFFVSGCPIFPFTSCHLVNYTGKLSVYFFSVNFIDYTFVSFSYCFLWNFSWKKRLAKLHRFGIVFCTKKRKFYKG